MSRLIERALLALAWGAAGGALWLAGCASKPAVDAAKKEAAVAVQPPASSPKPAEPVAVQVYAAGSLREALTRIARDHEARTGQRVQLTFGPSGLLRERIARQGASGAAAADAGPRAQVFASANMAHPRQLAEDGGWQAPVVFTRNQLCLLTSDKLHVVPATVLGTLLRPEVRLGTSTPGADPAGDYAWAFFRLAEAQQPGAYAQLDAKALKLSGGPASPQPPAGRSAYAWLMDEGRADAYLTYCTNAVAARREVPRLQVVQLPPGLAVGADYGLTVRADAPAAAQQFAKAVLEAPAQQVLRDLGFGTP